MAMIDRPLPAELQYAPDPITVDEAVTKAKLALLNDIKRSVYIYRCDLGGCNGCEIEIFSTITPVFDAERFGIKNTPSPRHADILVYTGAVTRSMRMPGIRAYEGAPDPKLVVAYGACGCSGGVFHDNYCVWGGADKIVPVDVYIPGCPPTPAQTIYGFALALGLLGQKQQHKDYVQQPGEVAALRYEDVPYKVRVALEKEARLLSGYRTGLDASNAFMDAMVSGSDVLAGVNALIAEQTDPRMVEVYSELRAKLAEMMVGEGMETQALLDAMQRIGAISGNAATKAIAGSVNV